MLRVWKISDEEGHALSRLVKRSNDPTVVKRAMIVLHSMQGFSPPKIADLVPWSEDWVRRVIKDYNRVGRDALYPKKNPGREPKFTPEIRRTIVTFAVSGQLCGRADGAWNSG